MSAPKTTVITVGYNSAGVIEGLLNSLPQGTPTIVVDNASLDTTADVARAVAPDAQIMRQPRNEGFGARATQGPHWQQPRSCSL